VAAIGFWGEERVQAQAISATVARAGAIDAPRFAEETP